MNHFRCIILKELQKNHKFYGDLIGLFDQLKSSFGDANTPNLQLKDLDSKVNQNIYILKVLY